MNGYLDTPSTKYKSNDESHQYSGTELRAGSREGAGVGAGPPNPEKQFENGAKFLCIKDKGRTISLFLHQ